MQTYMLSTFTGGIFSALRQLSSNRGLKCVNQVWPWRASHECQLCPAMRNLFKTRYMSVHVYVTCLSFLSEYIATNL